MSETTSTAGPSSVEVTTTTGTQEAPAVSAQLSQEDMAGALAAAREEAAATRVKLREAQQQIEMVRQEQERASMTETERLHAQLADARKAVELANAAARRAQVQADLAPHVIDAAAAVALMGDNIDDFLTSEGKPDPDRVLQQWSFLTPPKTSLSSPLSPANKPPSPAASDDSPLSMAEFNALTKAAGGPDERRKWVAENKHRIR